MHYRNGREAKNGDKIVQLNTLGAVVGFGWLVDAKPGNDYCNGMIVGCGPLQAACLCDCLHIDDVAQLLADQGLDERPAGK
jgi:hypothetical protein